ncbi:hypothetical protein L207DRAFT_570152 [Hyaloscypha variabilis F]|uniref:Zn(2)-C6 fungal-type domain-containing protein n=1 Tax=Hyaloscypha variabilis (strain UAMH 11265 / GT02V1 / F) TaxID=1149755 RepID=A0A2J6RAV9_HYAVF|nr:hypothetical protein L207DRAFT_570152 [Hyaloscypha variabilis F]
MASTDTSLVHRQRTKYQRSRAVKSRVRSGCVTCKCASAGYECDGYCYNTLARRSQSNPVLPTGSNVKNLRVPIPRVKSLPSTELVVQPSVGPRFESEIEHRCFLTFQESAASQLSGYYPSLVWERVVLQACHEAPWARNLVVAIGALHRHQTQKPLPAQEAGQVDGERERKSHYLFALQQYGTALGQLRHISAQEPDSEARLRYALISALLTTCFETYIGNREGAITQAKAGIDLLLKWTKEKEPTADSMVDDWTRVRRAAARSVYLDEDLLGAFHRLDYQLVLCKGLGPDRHRPDSFPSASHPFTSVNEACSFWDLVVRRILHFHSVQSVSEQHNPKGYEDENASTIGTKGKVYPKHMLVEQHNFKMAAEQFFRYFDPIFKSSRRKPGTNEYLLANLVMIRALSCRAAVSRGPSESEMYSDAFLRDYMLIIDLAQELIEDANKPLRKAVFNFDVTLGVSLFTVAHVCRDPKVRRSAIELLNRFPRREAWFDTLVAAKIATYIVTKEEKNMVHGFIPDKARLRLLRHETGPQKQWATIFCSKLVWKDGAVGREAIPPETIIL